MNKQERKDVRETANNNGYRQSNYDSAVQINKHGDTIKHIDSNRTVIGGKTYYGASDAKKAITGNS